MDNGYLQPESHQKAKGENRKTKYNNKIFATGRGRVFYLDFRFRLNAHAPTLLLNRLRVWHSFRVGCLFFRFGSVPLTSSELTRVVCDILTYSITLVSSATVVSFFPIQTETGLLWWVCSCVVGVTMATTTMNMWWWRQYWKNYCVAISSDFHWNVSPISDTHTHTRAHQIGESRPMWQMLSLQHNQQNWS